MKTHHPSLNAFHPLISRWFSDTFKEPTDIQQQAWPQIIEGRHVLITAPTGSGKTLTAFLWAIHQLATGAWEEGQVRVVYVSPLKALNNDVRKNLLHPLEKIEKCFNAAGTPFPSIRALTRSGDTPQDERRRMLRHPPEILILTPESLNIILSSKNGRRMLSGTATVILDEIHAVVATKRGTHLITAVERLAALAGEFQRIALSATVNPIDRVAGFIGGYRHTPGGGYEARPVKVIQSQALKSVQVRVRSPNEFGDIVETETWPALAAAFARIVQKNRSTLLFANSRRTTEKVTRLINDKLAKNAAYSHHGSLSKEIRLTVEQKLKNGDLSAIVATNSLELGIDIGDLDRVVLIQTPPTITSAVQRIGRSGHRVGETSRGDLFPTHGQDFLRAAVMARCVLEGDIEPLHPVECPLDVLAQVIVAMTGVEIWGVEALFDFIKSAWPYRHLTRRQFDLVLDMLAGRFADTHLRELRPRVSIDAVDNTIKARSGALLLVYLAGGTIPERGLFDLRLQPTKAKIGELDEEFVWERSIGDTFTMGAQCWRIMTITHNHVEVIPSQRAPGMIPFWRAEPRNRDFHFSERISTFLEFADQNVSQPQFGRTLQTDYALEPSAANDLIAFLKRQKEVTGSDLPHRHHLLIEHFNDPHNRSDGKQVVLHTLWGGRINRPYAMALAEGWEAAHGYRLEVFADDDCILLILPHDLNTDVILNLVNADNVEALLRARLEKTGFFGARFRENAGTALLLPKINFKKRLPLWLNRLRSKKLMDAVMGYPDFPILLETWRTCLNDAFDPENLKRMLDEIAQGEIRLSESITTAPSPFARNLIWQQTNAHMYKDDTPEYGKKSSLSDDLIQEVALSSRLRPAIPDRIIRDLDRKLKRTAAGYAPRSGDDLLDWVKERRLIPQNEWDDLVEAMARDGRDTITEMMPTLKHKLCRLTLASTNTACVTAVESLPHISHAMVLPFEEMKINTLDRQPADDLLLKTIEFQFDRYRENQKEKGDNGQNGAAALAETLRQFLSYYGPVRPEFIKTVLGLSQDNLTGLLETLRASNDIVIDCFREDTDRIEVCDRNNLEILLRMTRRSRRPDFKALAPEALPLFLATFQGLSEPGHQMNDLQDRLEQLFGYPAPVAAWEAYILPARLDPYYPEWMDSLTSAGDLIWFGCGDKKTGFAFTEDLDLFQPWDQPDASADADNLLKRLFPDMHAKYGFFDIQRHVDMSTAQLTQRLWALSWQGKVSNDSLNIIRTGIGNKFSAFKVQAAPHRGRRGRFNRWKSSRPLAGNWFCLGTDKPADPLDPMEAELLVKDRVRQLLRRYGLLFRELLARELPLLRWGKLFKTLRLMELSGEIISGHFFEGVAGAQFISGEAFRRLNRPLPEDAVFWLNAADPASLCGIPVEGLKKQLPARKVSNYVVFHGRNLVLTLSRSGKEATFAIPHDHPRIPDCLKVFKALVNRKFNPVRTLVVETINGVPAGSSDYGPVMTAFGFSKEYRGLELTRQVV